MSLLLLLRRIFYHLLQQRVERQPWTRPPRTRTTPGVARRARRHARAGALDHPRVLRPARPRPRRRQHALAGGGCSLDRVSRPPCVRAYTVCFVYKYIPALRRLIGLPLIAGTFTVLRIGRCCRSNSGAASAGCTNCDRNAHLFYLWDFERCPDPFRRAQRTWRIYHPRSAPWTCTHLPWLAGVVSA